MLKSKRLPFRFPLDSVEDWSIGATFCRQKQWFASHFLPSQKIKIKSCVSWLNPKITRVQLLEDWRGGLQTRVKEKFRSDIRSAKKKIANKFATQKFNKLNQAQLSSKDSSSSSSSSKRMRYADGRDELVS